MDGQHHPSRVPETVEVFRSRALTYLPLPWWEEMGRRHPRQKGRLLVLARDRGHALDVLRGTGMEDRQARAIMAGLPVPDTWGSPWGQLAAKGIIDPQEPGAYVTRRGLPGDEVFAVRRGDDGDSALVPVARVVSSPAGVSAVRPGR